MLTLRPYIITDEDTVNIDDSTVRTVLSITESSQSASMLAEATGTCKFKTNSNYRINKLLPIFFKINSCQ